MVIAPTVRACRDAGKAVKVELALERGELGLIEILRNDDVRKFARSVDNDCRGSVGGNCVCWPRKYEDMLGVRSVLLHCFVSHIVCSCDVI